MNFRRNRNVAGFGFPTVSSRSKRMVYDDIGAYNYNYNSIWIQVNHLDSRSSIKITNIGTSSSICHPDSLHILLCGGVNNIQVRGVIISIEPPLTPAISCTTLYSCMIHHFCFPPVLYRMPNVIHQTFRQPLTSVEEAFERDGPSNNLVRRTWLEATLQSNRLVDRIGEVTIESSVTAQGDINFRLISEEVRVAEQRDLLYIVDRTDQYRGMRLDVDNMTYEELLALEERIGSVTTGLSKETVVQSLKPSKFFTFAESDVQKECCSICQEDYVEDDELGTLSCGHGFHVLCIEQWLTCKNICPLCKSAGLCASSSH
ncbi:hypothetical protein QQ045_005383 [Rhodiola kirilowii]